MKCSSENCDEKAAIIVYWPGKSPPPEMCFSCAAKARTVADAMGLTMHFDKLSS